MIFHHKRSLYCKTACCNFYSISRAGSRNHVQKRCEKQKPNWVNRRKMIIMSFISWLFVFMFPLVSSIIRSNTKNHHLKYVTDQVTNKRQEKKTVRKKNVNRLEKEPMEKNVHCCQTTSNSQLDTKPSFFYILPLTCIGFLGRQQLFDDDDIFIHGLLSLFAQRILSFLFVIFQRKILLSIPTDIRIHWNNTLAYVFWDGMREYVLRKK